MRRLDIEAHARKILEDHGLVQIPVDPLKIAHALKIRVMNAKFSENDKSGAAVKRGDNISIYIENDDQPTRKRFSIAHEIGHAILHFKEKDDGEYVDNRENFRSINLEIPEQWNEERKIEWEANVFAAELLMPKDAIIRYWNEYLDPIYMAWLFQVSETAMRIRLSEFNLIKEI